MNLNNKNQFSLYLTGDENTEVILQVQASNPESAKKIYEGLEALLMNMARFDLETEWEKHE